jgi:tRNA threonylcarbamoyladenosine modification (KEOPS) complex  Pcc1 subunit
MRTLYESELKELQGKTFTDVKELEKAEAKVKAEQEKKEVALAEKKADLAKINTTANDYLKLVAENNKKRAELKKAEDKAYAAYKAELDDFAEKHQGYHLTYTRKGDSVEFKVEEVKQKTIEDYFKDIEETRKAFRNFFDGFWLF